MMPLGESRREGTGRNSLLTPRRKTLFGTCNVTTIYQARNAAIIAKERARPRVSWQRTGVEEKDKK